MRRALRDLFVCFGASDSDFDGAELIVGELLGNAVRYAPGPVTVHLSWADDEAVFTIHDRGPGFNPRMELPPDLGTSGRGLYIVKKLARNVTVSCSPAGSTVTATLPVRKPEISEESA